MVESKRKKGETFESFFRRFNKQLQQSGSLFQARKVRFFERPKSKTKLKAAAGRREEIRAKRDYLRKIGKLPEEDLRRSPGARP